MVGDYWKGPVLCSGRTVNGQPCAEPEIFGMDFCVLHMPDDMLEEAEGIRGAKRCRWHFGEDDACRKYAKSNTEPPACTNHGANAGSRTSIEAAKRDVKDGEAQRLVAIITENPDILFNPPKIEDPLTELLMLAAEVKALKEILKVHVSRLTELRYSSGRAGEQTRAEILLYTDSQTALAKLLVAIARLNIDQRLAAISETRVTRMDRALTAGLEASGCDLEAQEKARQVMRRELARST